MIIKFFLFLIFSVIKFILGVLPTFPALDVDVDFTILMQVLRFVNQLVNLKVIGGLFLAYLSVVLIFFIWSFINWLLHKIPGVS